MNEDASIQTAATGELTMRTKRGSHCSSCMLVARGRQSRLPGVMTGAANLRQR